MERHMAETWRVFASRGSEHFIQYRKQKNGGGWREVWRRDTRWEHSFRAVRHLREGLFPASLPKKYWGTAHCISVSAQGSAAGEKQMATHTTQPAADSSHLCSSTRSSSRAREQQLTAAEHHHHARCTAAFFCCFFCQNYATADSSAP